MTIANKKSLIAVSQVLVSVISLAMAITVVAAAEEDALEAGFKQPPAEARPRVWWHWMNGNITRDGIAKDLEWMQRIGIGGVQNFDAAMETPVIVDERLVYMSPQWKQAFSFAVDKAAELGLEFAIASSAGWSLTGGPWVSPQDAMKKLVWSESAIAGGAAVDQVLPVPPAVPGPFQSLPASYKHGHNEAAIPDTFYRDTAVLAYPMPPAANIAQPEQVTVNGVPVDAALLSNGDLATGIELPADNGKSPGVIDIVYTQPVTIQSAVVYIANFPADVMRGPLQPTLQAQASDGTWQSITRFTLGAVPATASFPAVTASQFRLLFTRGKPSSTFNFAPAPGIDLSGLASLASSSPQQPLLTDLRVGKQPKVHAFERKAGFALVDDYHQLDGNDDDTASPEIAGIDPAAVLDLTDRMAADGRLQWNAPPGDWKILRLGYSLTGKTNSPATVEATGLEVDKFDGDAVARYLNTYLGMYEAVVGEGAMGARGLSALLTDSTEAGPANWTPQLVAQFQRLRGYDPTPWLPTLTGDIVGSRQQSNRFLYDFRHTLAQLNATEHYGTVARVSHEHELTVYGESLEGNRSISTLGDDLEMRRFADIPMAAMWSYGKGGAPAPHYVADMRGAASVAHVYGKPIAAAESLTSIMAPWAHAPADLQPMMDAEFLSGINRPVIHTSVHQPVDEKVPGLSLHVFGQYFTRHDTWAEMARPWIDYLSRNSFLLQQGHNVADVAYFYGEEPPLAVLAASQGYPADVPTRYAYDFIPPDAILNELTVEDGDLVTRGGARYKLLYLSGSSRDFMTLPLLRRVAELVEQGATLVGEPPNASPSLADDQQAFSELVNQLWNNAPAARVGSGRVIAGVDVESALASIGVVADVGVGNVVVSESGSDSGSGASTADAAAAIQFVHRRAGNHDIYFIANRGAERTFDARFRVVGKAPEIWRADNAAIAPVSYQSDADGTVIPLSMEAWESFFVVFRRPATEPSLTVDAVPMVPLMTIDGPWKVSFQSNRGAPDQTVFPALTSLAEHDDPGIRYFSGVASYRTEFTVPQGAVDAGVMQLNLGEVGDIAEVGVNGQYAGTAWKPPYMVDVGQFVRSGTNQLDVRVANLWVNRLIGDRQPEMEPVTYTTFKTYMPNAPLRPSGLIGPVELRVAHGAGN